MKPDTPARTPARQHASVRGSASLLAVVGASHLALGGLVGAAFGNLPAREATLGAAAPSDSSAPARPRPEDDARPWQALELAADVEQRHLGGAERERAELEALDDSQLMALLSGAPERLGSVSFGRANRGWLLGGVRVPEGEHWQLVEPPRAWGTRETVEALTAAIDEVAALHPGAPRLYIGQLSRERGGYLRPHRSHQSGRDVDLGYYYLEDAAWYTRATPENLDVQRTWALIDVLTARDALEYVFVDYGVERLLRRHAELVASSPARLRQIFEGDAAHGALVRHAWGHATHMHLRFRSPVAVGIGRRLLAADHERVRRLRVVGEWHARR